MKKYISTAVSYLLILLTLVIAASLIYGLTVEYNPFHPDMAKTYDMVHRIGIYSSMLILVLGLIKLILVWED